MLEKVLATKLSNENVIIYIKAWRRNYYQLFSTATNASVPEESSGAISTGEEVELLVTAVKVMGMVELERIPFICTGTVDPGN